MHRGPKGKIEGTNQRKLARYGFKNALVGELKRTSINPVAREVVGNVMGNGPAKTEAEQAVEGRGVAGKAFIDEPHHRNVDGDQCELDDFLQTYNGQS